MDALEALHSVHALVRPSSSSSAPPSSVLPVSRSLLTDRESSIGIRPYDLTTDTQRPGEIIKLCWLH